MAHHLGIRLKHYFSVCLLHLEQLIQLLWVQRDILKKRILIRNVDMADTVVVIVPWRLCSQALLLLRGLRHSQIVVHLALNQLANIFLVLPL